MVYSTAFTATAGLASRLAGPCARRATIVRRKTRVNALYGAAGRIRTRIEPLLRGRPLPVRLRQRIGASGVIRTPSTALLRRVSLPVGLLMPNGYQLNGAGTGDRTPVNAIPRRCSTTELFRQLVPAAGVESATCRIQAGCSTLSYTGVVLTAGLEPATTCLRSRCSAIELCQPNWLTATASRSVNPLRAPWPIGRSHDLKQRIASPAAARLRSSNSDLGGGLGHLALSAFGGGLMPAAG